MNTRLIISLLCAGALAFACGPRSHSEAPSAALATAALLHAAATPAVRTRKRALGGKSEVTLDSHLSVNVAPKEVRFALQVTNVGNKHAELNFANGKTYDFVVVDSVGREVWHWSRGRMFTQSVQNKQLGSGDVMQVGETSTLSSGRYTAIATLNSSNYPVEQRSDFVVP
jgi:hypothetical protein